MTPCRCRRPKPTRRRRNTPYRPAAAGRAPPTHRSRLSSRSPRSSRAAGAARRLVGQRHFGAGPGRPDRPLTTTGRTGAGPTDARHRHRQHRRRRRAAPRDERARRRSRPRTDGRRRARCATAAAARPRPAHARVLGLDAGAGVQRADARPGRAVRPAPRAASSRADAHRSAASGRRRKLPPRRPLPSAAGSRGRRPQPAAAQPAAAAPAASPAQPGTAARPPAPRRQLLAATGGRAGAPYAIGAPDEGAERARSRWTVPGGAVEVADRPQPQPMDDELPPEPLDNPRRLLVWPAPDASTQQALSDRGYRPVIVHSREEVDAQIAAFPAALFVDPLTGPITRTALQSLRQAAVAAEVPVLVTAGLGQATREAAYGADPAVLLKALAPRDSEQHPPRVLLIEEHEEIALALTATLERRGMQVAQAASDADAVTLAAQIRPNLVVMDLMQVRRRRRRDRRLAARERPVEPHPAGRLHRPPSTRPTCRGWPRRDRAVPGGTVDERRGAVPDRRSARRRSARTEHPRLPADETDEGRPVSRKPRHAQPSLEPCRLRAG